MIGAAQDIPTSMERTSKAKGFRDNFVNDGFFLGEHKMLIA